MMKLTGSTMVYFPPVGDDAFPLADGATRTTLGDWAETVEGDNFGPGYPAEVYTDPDEVPKVDRGPLIDEATTILESLAVERLEQMVLYLRAVRRGDEAAGS